MPITNSNLTRDAKEHHFVSTVIDLSATGISEEPLFYTGNSSVVITSLKAVVIEGTAAADAVDIGTRADADAIVTTASDNISSGLSAGDEVDLLSAAGFVTDEVAAGEIVTYSNDGTSGGAGTVVLVGTYIPQDDRPSIVSQD